MKQAISILLIWLLLLPVLSKSALYIWFKANQDTIAAELCINKENKKRQDCKGCCVLNEQLEKVEDTPKESSTPINNKKELSEIALVFYFNQILVEPIYPMNKELSSNRYTLDVLTPHVLKLIKPPTNFVC